MSDFETAAAHLKTPRDLLRFAISQFHAAQLCYGHGTTRAWDEAAYLIAHTLHLPLDYFDSLLDSQLLPDEIHRVLHRIQRRVQERLPAAYLTREAWLGEFDFYVDERVIVPRSFIAEILRDQTLTPWIEFPELVHDAADLCTGSGCLAILMAHYFPDAHIDAVDLSADALDVARMNQQKYALETQLHLHHGDLFTPLHGRTYDLIVSNPPYVDAESVAALPPEYQHEPTLALGSGEDGLELTRRILVHAAEYLNPQGVLVVEIGHNRNTLEAQFPHVPFEWLNTESGDGFVFLLTREQLIASFGEPSHADPA